MAWALNYGGCATVWMLLMALAGGSISCTAPSSNRMIPCSFKLPLAYNDGRPLEDSRHEEILDRIFSKFDGYTIEGTETGAYRREDTGTKQVEQMLKVNVAVHGEAGVRELRTMVRIIGWELDQEAMYFEVDKGNSVEIVPSMRE